MNINYQKELDLLIDDLHKEKKMPSLLLHSCCAPCSSYVLEYLSQYFKITVYYYNPNIFPKEEYEYRIKEQQKLIDLLPAKYKVEFIPSDYTPIDFFQISEGLEREREGGMRCIKCYRLRLEEAAKLAKRMKFDYFTTTLSISPMKDAAALNIIGKELEKEYGMKYLISDFKKKDGYKRSVVLSKQYGLYRQDYCGCIFSKEISNTLQ